MKGKSNLVFCLFMAVTFWEQQLTILENFLHKRAAWLDTSGWKP